MCYIFHINFNPVLLKKNRKYAFSRWGSVGKLMVDFTDRPKSTFESPDFLKVQCMLKYNSVSGTEMYDVLVISA